MALVVATSSLLPAQRGGRTAEVEDAVRNFYVSMMAADLDRAMAALAGDFQMVAGKSGMDRAQFRRMMSQMKRGAPQQLTGFKTLIKDNTAETTYFRVATSAPRQRVTLKETANLRRVDGKWLIYRLEAVENK